MPEQARRNAPCPDGVLAYASDHLTLQHGQRFERETHGSYVTNVARCDCGEVFEWGRREQAHLDHWLRVLADYVWAQAKRDDEDTADA